MKNITLAVDEDVLKAVRRYAAQHETTVNGLVREHLERIAARESRAHDAVERLRQLSEKSKGEVGEITWTRDDLYER
ncbi:MAG TPA: DUF6364 family protein [Afifellaceae bacterium]|nr:DUF6364 family protein [Afifellaceae bacterium]